MKRCCDCKWAHDLDETFIQCTYPLPVWIKRAVLNPLVDGPLADNVAKWHPHLCPCFERKEA